VYDLYFLRRFIEEMVLAQTSCDEQERAVHLQACRYYGDLLHMNDEEDQDQTRGLADRI
jgi:peroxiredoxin family protein